MLCINPATRKSSHGAALVISLILLIVLTMVVITTMRNTVMEEKMAGNLRNHDLAFQAAEAALREGEVVLGSSNADTIAALPCRIDLNSVDFHNDDWNNACEYSDSTIAHVPTQPRYYLEALSQNSTSLLMGAGASSCFYRVTARGMGADGQAMTILQSTFVNFC